MCVVVGTEAPIEFQMGFLHLLSDLLKTMRAHVHIQLKRVVCVLGGIILKNEALSIGGAHIVLVPHTKDDVDHR